MNEQEIKIAIAEACGWRPHSELNNTWCAPHQSTHPLVCDLIPLPDYYGSLDELHAAKRQLLTTVVLCRKFEDELKEALYSKYYDGSMECRLLECRLWGQPADVQARALVKALGKWKEAQ